MPIPRLVLIGIYGVGWVAVGANAVSAQTFPNKSIRIVTSTAGGGSDFVTRLIAQGISGPLGQQVTTDNRPSLTLGELVSKAPPDGYTLLVANNPIWAVPLMQGAPYDPVKDLAPVAWLVKSPQVLVVHPAMPTKTLKELIALAKSRPGELNYSSSGIGGNAHITAELLKSMAGVNIVHIPYANNTVETTDLLSGQVQMAFRSPGAVSAYVKSGRLRALAVTSAQPSALWPELPPVAATVPGYEAVAIYGMWAPARTPDTVIRRLNQEIARVLLTPDIKAKLLNAGVEAVGSSPEEFANAMKADMSRLDQLIKAGAIK